MFDVTIRDVGTPSWGTTSTTPTIPAVQVGDLMVLIVFARADSLTFGCSAGWDERYDPGSQTKGSYAVYTRIYQDSDGDPTITPSSSGNHVSVIFTLYNFDSAIFDVSISGSNFAAPASPYNVTISSFNTVADGALAFYLWSSTDDNTWAYQSGGGTQRISSDYGGNTSFCVVTELVSSAGATGDQVSQQTNVGPDWGRILWFAIKPAAVKGLIQNYVAGLSLGQKVQLKARVYWESGSAPLLCGINTKDGLDNFDQNVVHSEVGTWQTLILDYVHDGDDSSFKWGVVAPSASVFYVDLASMRITDDAPQFEWSDDNGVTWQGPEYIADEDPIPLNLGLSAEFSGTGVTTPTWTWTPVGSAPGVCSVVEGDPQGIGIAITAGGACGVATFYWETAEDSGTGTTSDSPQEVTPGYSVQFTVVGNPGVDDYDVGDASVLGSFYTPAFVADDLWTFTFKEIPIPLADGVSIQFVTQTEQDFYQWDEFSFILMSTILVKFTDTTDLTIDAKGLINPNTDLFADTIGQIIYSLIRVFVEWEDADFDLLSFDTFDVSIPYTAGLVIDSPESITSIIDTLLTGIPTLYSITIAGKFYIQELVLPSGIPVLSITDEQIMDLPEFNQLPDITKRVYLEYDKNYTTNTSKDLSGVSQERLAWLKRGNRSISRKDDSVLINYPMASDLGPLETVLNLRADAGALADKLLALYQVPHETVDVQIGLQSVQLDIGDIVMMTRENFGQDAGQLYIVQGISINFADKQSTVTLWR